MIDEKLSDPSILNSSQQPLFLGALLAMSLATATLQLLRAILSIIQTAGQSRIAWFSGKFEGWEYVVQWLFMMLLPALLVVGIVGVWMRKPGARRLTVLVAGGLILIACVELIVGFAQLAKKTPRAATLLEIVDALINVGQAFLSGYGLLLLLVIVLTHPAGRHEAMTH